MRVLVLWIGATLAGMSLVAQGADSGRQVFVSRCAGCHGTDGNGGELGPNIATRIPTRTDQDLSTVIRQGLTTAGMLAFPNLSDTEDGSGPFLENLATARGQRPGAHEGHDSRRPRARRTGAQSKLCRRSTARRRSKDPLASQER